MPSTNKLLLASTTLLLAVLGDSDSRAHAILFVPLDKVRTNSLSTLKKKQWPVFFSTIQSELKARWKLKADGSAVKKQVPLADGALVDFATKCDKRVLSSEGSYDGASCPSLSVLLEALLEDLQNLGRGR